MKSPVLLSTALTLALLALSACSTTREQTVTQVEQVKPPAISHPPMPASLHLYEIENAWKVVPVQGTAMFCTAPETYQVMSLNNAEMQRYLLDVRSVLNYYRQLK